MCCLKRGAIDMAFKMFAELSEDKLVVGRSALLKLYDLCSLKHSIRHADLLT